MQKNRMNALLTSASSAAYSFCSKVAETIKTAEGWNYLLATIESSPKVADENKDLLKKYASQAMKVPGVQETDASWWTGHEIKQAETLPAAVETRLEDAAAALQNYGREISINYAVDPYEKGTRFAVEYLTPEGEPAPDTVAKHMGAMVAGWMQEQSMVNKGGGIYEADKQDGKALRDNHGREIDVSTARFVQVLTDPRKGLETVLKTRGVPVNLVAVGDVDAPTVTRKEEETPSVTLTENSVPFPD